MVRLPMKNRRKIYEVERIVSKSNIILIGMPGAGKSTLGVVLAKNTGRDFLDCDLLIQNTTGKLLADLIEERGAEGFIELENEILRGVNVANTVISTGGSACYSDEAMDHLRTIGTSVYLKVSYEELVKRLGDLEERGVVMRQGPGMGLRGLLEERAPLYEKHADIIVEPESESIIESAKILVSRLAE